MAISAAFGAGTYLEMITLVMVCKAMNRRRIIHTLRFW